MQEVRDPETFRKVVLESPEPTVVLFWATWCPFCRRFKADFDRLSTQVPSKFASVYLDDESNRLWEDYTVEVVPTIALFQDGDLVDRQDGILGYGLDRRAVQDFVKRITPLLS